MKELLKGTSFAFSIKIFSAALSFVFAMILARYAGAEGAGAYYLIFSIIAVGSVFGRFGTDISLLRFTAAHAGAKGFKIIKGAYNYALWITFTASLLVTLILFFGADLIANFIFKNPGLVPLIKLGSFAVIPFSISLLHAEALKGLKSVFFHMIYLPHAGIIVTPFLICTLLLFPEIKIEYLVIAFIGANLVTMLASFFTFHFKIPQIKAAKADFEVKKLMNSSFPLFILGLTFIIMEWSSTFVLEIFSGTESVGIYNIAYRLAAPMTFILTALNVIVAPRFAESFHSGDYTGIISYLKNSVKIAFVVGAPILLIILLIPDLLLSLFGGEFTAGSTALMILATGQFFNILTGTVPQLLMMSGNENNAMINTISGGLTCLILNIILVPFYGINGAAVATVTGMALINILSWFHIRNKIKVKVSI